ncbi:MAG: hypothetical protein FJ304_15620 [Planctomycetes bacterium]|nr:hypothetical protein [Planctomycetota bacterium]
MRLTLAVVAALALAAPAPAQDVSLKWTLKEGDQFYTNTVADMDMTMTVLGTDVNVKMKMTGVQRYKILSSKPGATKVELTMLALKMTAEGLPAGAGGVGDIGDRVKGATVTATLNDDMEVTKVEGYDKFIDKLAGDNEAERKQMKTQFSETAVGQMVSQVFSFAPAKAVKVGDTWNRTDKVPTGGFGDASVKQKYKLDSVTGGVAKLGLEGDMSFKAGDGAIPGLPEGVKVTKFDLKADKITGTVLFDTKAGRLKETKQNMSFSGTIAMSANGMDLEMKMKIKGTQTATVTDKNPTKD